TKQDTLTAKELAIEEKIQAYEQVADVIGRKLQIVKSKDLTLKQVRSELKQMRQTLKERKKEKSALKNNIPLIELEIKSIEKEISAQKMLLALKEDNKQPTQEALEANQVKQETIQAQVTHINERISFVDIQIEAAKDYINMLHEKRVSILKNTLLAKGPYSVKLWETSFLAILFGWFLLFIAAKRKEKHIDAEASEPLGKKISINLLRKGFWWSLVFISVYFILSFSGYHQLAVYLVPRMVFVVIVVFALFLIHHVVDLGAHKIGEKTKIITEQPTAGHAFLDASITLFGWILFIFGILFVTEALGIRYEAATFLGALVQKPFFKLGEVSISVWVLFKAGAILWLFIVCSNLLDGAFRNSLYKKMRLDESVQYTFSVTIKYLMLIIGVLIGLSALGVKLAALTVFAGTIGIGIGFGLQDIAKNFISGIIMLIERPVKVGDYIEVSDLPGKVRAIKARSTIVDTFDNISVIVPNADFMNQKVINWSYSDKVTRVKISVGVVYGADTELVKASLMKVAKSHEKVLHNPEPYVWFENFGDSSLNFNLYIWTNEPQNRFGLKSDLHYMIDKIFRERKITIAFPQRDLHFKSSDVPLK
ncbi:MAG: mechanosensitive ion channel domain-containing protein, partial [Candidatus Omnitrophota bacterium]